MLLKIDFESETPIYVQLKNQIIEGIALGKLEPGESLPSVRQLAQDIGINLHTVNKTYGMLKDDGFITMDRRKGAVVSKISSNVTEKILENLSEDLNGIIAEAYCRGMKKDEFMKLCSEIFEVYNGGVQ